MSVTQIGTSHFPTFNAACEYYRTYGESSRDVMRKAASGEIHIGPPELHNGDRLILIDNHLRYAIVRKD